MEAFEERALCSFPLQPKLWLRYVDDTFVVWSHGTEALGDFHRHLNAQDQAIQFTTEEESEGKIPFLDALVERKGSKAVTSVYHKPTSTERYIHFHSHHHPRVLTGVI